MVIVTHAAYRSAGGKYDTACAPDAGPFALNGTTPTCEACLTVLRERGLL